MSPAIDSDMSVTGWFVMALQSARMAGIEVPSPALRQESTEFLGQVARDGGSRYAYRVTRRRHAAPHRRGPALPPVSRLGRTTTRG